MRARATATGVLDRRLPRRPRSGGHRLPRLIALLLVAILTPAAAEDDGLRNRLAGHSSPYLAMHGEDPVHWQDWGPDALERARREDKLLYVSVGYFSCHWCHVMQRESFQDATIAALINRHFIPVKVDRELQPALDAQLIEFVEASRGYSGWPLNVFLTPEGHPLIGVVYLPPDQFRDLLSKLQVRWSEQRAEMQRIARRTGQALSSGSRSLGPELPPKLAGELSRALQEVSMQLADPLEGGFGGPNKFPQVPQLQALLAVLQQRPDRELEDFLRLTLDHMAERGLRDHLRGGFFRYVVDPSWSVPHFEKMLYDNALLATLYLQAAARLDEPRYRAVAFDTLDFMTAHMDGAEGGLLASLSAVDDAGVEGGFYLWSDQELEKLLPEPSAQVARLHWGLDGPPELPEGHHLGVAMGLEDVAEQLGIEPEEAQARLGLARRALRQAQERRSLPRDTKILAGWNGLALEALSRAAAEEPRFRAAAQEIRDHLLERLWQDGRLLRARAGADELGSASLEDYAYVAAGLWHWSRLPGNEADRVKARQVLDQAWARFHGPLGWRLSEQSLLPHVAYDPLLPDGPMPAPAAVVIDTTRDMAAAGDPALRERARAALNVAPERLRESPFRYASHIRAVVRAGRPSPE